MMIVVIIMIMKMIIVIEFVMKMVIVIINIIAIIIIIIIIIMLKSSRNNVVGIATGYWLDDLEVGVRVPEGSRIFSPPCHSDSALVSTQPPIQWVPEALSPGVKRPGREADHSPPASAEFKKMWIYTYTPPYAFMA
jgi:hypothetical protein